MSTSSVGVKQSCTSAMASSARGFVDAGLLVRVGGRAHDLDERRVVVGRVDRTGGGAGDERQRLHVERVVAVLVRVFGTDDQRSSRAVAHARAVEDAELAGDERRVADDVLRHFLLELRTGVERAVLVVLPRDAGEDVLHLRLVDAVLVRVRGSEEGERRGRGHRRQRCRRSGGAEPVRPEKPESFSFSTPIGHRDVDTRRRRRRSAALRNASLPVAHMFSSRVTGL